MQLWELEVTDCVTIMYTVPYHMNHILGLLGKLLILTMSEVEAYGLRWKLAGDPK